MRSYFEDRNAFDPSHAVAYEPPTNLHRRQFDALMGRGILLDTGGGRYWIGRQAVRLEKERQRAAGILMLKIILLVVVVSVAGAATVAALH